VIAHRREDAARQCGDRHGRVRRGDPEKRIAALAGATRLHAIVTRDGNPSLLKAAGIPYSQLGRLPK